MDTLEKERELGQSRLLHIAGDQKTIGLLRGLHTMRCEDDNGCDRLDYMQLNIGLFHFDMTYAVSLHKQYMGTSSMRGLRHAIDITKRKGLSNAKTKGTFHYDLRELIHHSTEAHILSLWLLEGGVGSIVELRKRSPDELKKIAERIFIKHTSSAALSEMDQLPDDEKDELRREAVMWCRDALHYMLFVKAIKHGDVGIIEAMLPHLLYRFIGGGHNKYATEVMELLMMLHRQLSPAAA